MDIYTPLFHRITESSLWDEEDWVIKVFFTLLASKDADFIVRKSNYALAFLARKTEVEIEKALKILSSPDKRRPEGQPHEGRRILKVPDGWFIVQGKFYQDLMRKTHRNQYQAKKQAEYRNKKKGRPIAGETAFCNADDKTQEHMLEHPPTK